MPRKRWTTPGIRLPRIPTGAFLMGEADRDDARRLAEVGNITEADLLAQVHKLGPKVIEWLRTGEPSATDRGVIARFLLATREAAPELWDALTDDERAAVLEAA